MSAAEGPVALPEDREIRYDPALLEREMGALLRGLLRDLDREPFTSLLGDAIRREVEARVAEIRARLADDFRLVVIGEFKRGKSSLINAILGEEVVPVDVTPETIAIARIRHGEAAEAALRLTDGGRVPLEPEELRRERLEPLVERLGPRLAHVDIVRPIERLQGLVLVDTPGTGDLFRRFDDLVAEHLVAADAVVIVVSPLSPLSRSEIAFHLQALAPHDFPKLYVVLNMIDLVRGEADRQRVIANVRARVAQHFPGAHLVALSALDEIARQKGGARPLPEAAGDLAAAFDGFRAELDQLVVEHRDAIQLQRGLDLARGLARDLSARVEVIRAGVGAGAAELDAMVRGQEAALSAVEAEAGERSAALDALFAELEAEAQRWLRGFATRLIGEIEQQAGAVDAEQLERHLPFFVTDTLRQALAAAVDAHLPRLREAAAELIEESAARGICSDDELSAACALASFDAPRWQRLDTLHLLADQMFVGVGLLVDALGGLLGGDGTKLVLARLQGKQAALDEALAATLSRGYTRLREEFEGRLQAALEERRAAVGTGLAQAQALRQEESATLEARSAQLADLATRLASFESGLDAVRGKLPAA